MINRLALSAWRPCPGCGCSLCPKAPCCAAGGNHNQRRFPMTDTTMTETRIQRLLRRPARPHLGVDRGLRRGLAGHAMRPRVRAAFAAFRRGTRPPRPSARRPHPARLPRLPRGVTPGAPARLSPAADLVDVLEQVGRILEDPDTRRPGAAPPRRSRRSAGRRPARRQRTAASMSQMASPTTSARLDRRAEPLGRREKRSGSGLA